MTTTVTRNPAYTPALAPQAITGWSTSRDGNNLFHNVINNPAVDVTLRPASLRSGTITYLFANQSDALNCEAAHAGAGVFTLTDTTLSYSLVYVVSGNIVTTLDDVSRVKWTVEVGFQEVSS